jgi:hypothetical protein
MDSGNSIAWVPLISATIGAAGTVWAAVIVTRKKNKAGDRPGDPEKRRWWILIGIVILAVTMQGATVSVLWPGRVRASENLAVAGAQLGLKNAKMGLADQLSASALYFKDDFHWPSTPPLDVVEVHKSIAVQEKIVGDALCRFRENVEFVGKVFGKQADDAVQLAMRQSNDVRVKVLRRLINPPSDETELIQLKADLLKDLALLIGELCP